MEANVRIQLKNFWAVEEADILLNGITVVAGINGSGKSTLSKLIYYTYHNIIHYEEIVQAKLYDNLRSIIRFLDLIIRNTSKDENELNRKLNILEREEAILRKEKISDINHFKNEWVLLANQIFAEYFENINKKNTGALSEQRIQFVLRGIFRNDKQKSNTNDDVQDVDFNSVIQKINELFTEASQALTIRNASILRDSIQRVFNGDIPTEINIVELNDKIFSLDALHIGISYNIQNVIYIDTPFMFDMEHKYVAFDYRVTLRDILKQKAENKNNNTEIYRWLSGQIMEGEADYDTKDVFSDDFLFKRSDGSVFNIKDCATGLQAFAILQLLIKNGQINDKTLIIIDEPEAHLHPQWITEYANLIVNLNKATGAKFLLASHNPDMVSAIRYISEAKNSDFAEILNFYLAQPVPGSKFKFKFNHLEQNIEPIFESFNLSFERLKGYIS